ncbi:MAG: hypothetical protein P8X50_10730 [Maritimibacter sp.]
MSEFGKWAQRGVPKKGWTCEDVEDLEDDRRVCEMCEHQEIRFVHYMSHPNYQGSLACGCDCAGRMEDDYVKAQQRDSAMRSAASKRKRFPKLKSWKLSQNGNPTLRMDGYRVTIFPKKQGYKFVVKPPSAPDIWGKRIYETVPDAQKAAFDAISSDRNK